MPREIRLVARWPRSGDAEEWLKNPGSAIDQQVSLGGSAPAGGWISTGRWVDQHWQVGGLAPVAGWISTGRWVDQHRQVDG